MGGPYNWVLNKDSETGKSEEPGELGISVSLITFGPDPYVDHLGDLLAVL